MLKKTEGQSRMNNPETLVTLVTQDTEGQSRMNNPEILVTLVTQDTQRRKTKHKSTAQHRKLKR